MRIAIRAQWPIPSATWRADLTGSLGELAKRPKDGFRDTMAHRILALCGTLWQRLVCHAEERPRSMQPDGSPSRQPWLRSSPI